MLEPLSPSPAALSVLHPSLSQLQVPTWVQGSLRGEYIRRALDLRSWSAATDLVRDWEASGEIGVVKKPDMPSIPAAVDFFVNDLTAQKLSHETVRKYDNLLRKRLLRRCV